MDVSALVAVLAPCMGLLMGVVGAAADEVGRSVGSELLEHAKRLWAKLRPHVEEKPAALEAAQDVAARPDDDRARGALEIQLEKLLSADAALADEIAPLLRDAVNTGAIAVGERSVAIAGDQSGMIITGDGATIER